MHRAFTPFSSDINLQQMKEIIYKVHIYTCAQEVFICIPLLVSVFPTPHLCLLLHYTSLRLLSKLTNIDS